MTATTAATQEHLDQAEVAAFVTALDFVREYAIRIVAVTPGAVTIELPFDKRFSGPPGQFPASMVGAAGDVAAVSSCLSLLPHGFAPATLDFTVKMTGIAKGEMLRARGRVLQDGRTNSVGAADVYVVTSGVEPERQLIRSLTRKEGKAKGRSPGWAARRHRCLRDVRGRGGRRYRDCGDREGSCQGECRCESLGHLRTPFRSS